MPRVSIRLRSAGWYGSVTLDRYTVCPATLRACRSASTAAFFLAVSHLPHSSGGRFACGRYAA
jgi:hypothetical protein